MTATDAAPDPDVLLTIGAVLIVVALLWPLFQWAARKVAAARTWRAIEEHLRDEAGGR